MAEWSQQDYDRFKVFLSLMIWQEKNLQESKRKGEQRRKLNTLQHHEPQTIIRFFSMLKESVQASHAGNDEYRQMISSISDVLTVNQSDETWRTFPGLGVLNAVFIDQYGHVISPWTNFHWLNMAVDVEHKQLVIKMGKKYEDEAKDIEDEEAKKAFDRHLYELVQSGEASQSFAELGLDAEGLSQPANSELIKMVHRFMELAPEAYEVQLLIDKSKAQHQAQQHRRQAIMGYVNELIRSKNIILHGAPGTGKTYLARDIAASVIGVDREDLKDPKGPCYDLDGESIRQFDMVQFHPNYDYTDFVEGLRPGDLKSGGFKLVDGSFKRFVDNAKEVWDKDQNPRFVFVIDEINRGDLARIFGELFLAIDPDKRGDEGAVTTQYSNLHAQADYRLQVPPNVYIIGTMNDVDRNVESFDFAMRRRFRFIEVTPEEAGRRMMDEGVLAETAFKCMQRLNAAIRGADESDGGSGHDLRLGPEYEIGPSYFIFRDEEGKQLCGDKLPSDDKVKPMLDDLWKFQLAPLIGEYLRGRDGQERRETMEYLESQFKAGAQD